MRLPEQDSAVGRGLKTTVQAIIGFMIGLVVVVWAVPGVPAAVLQYVQHNWVSIALTFGIPSGVASFVWNKFFRSDSEVKTY